MGNMGNVGGKRTRRVDSLTNRGCIFGSMAGLAPTVGLNPNLLNVLLHATRALVVLVVLTGLLVSVSCMVAAARQDIKDCVYNNINDNIMIIIV